MLTPGQFCTARKWQPGLQQIKRTLCAEAGSAGRIDNAMWCYPEAFDDSAELAGWMACYPSLLRCFIDGEAVRAQAGGYYGGWITDDVVGPFKGEPGTGHW